MCEPTPKLADNFNLNEAPDSLASFFFTQEESRAHFSLCPIQGPKNLQDLSSVMQLFTY